MKRILAFDVGDKRIGVAVSDALGITAQPVETYHRKGGAEKDAEYLLALAKKYAPCTLLFLSIIYFSESFSLILVSALLTDLMLLSRSCEISA